jgi:hypothetical protein
LQSQGPQAGSKGAWAPQIPPSVNPWTTGQYGGAKFGDTAWEQANPDKVQAWGSLNDQWQRDNNQNNPNRYLNQYASPPTQPPGQMQQSGGGSQAWNGQTSYGPITNPAIQAQLDRIMNDPMRPRYGRDTSMDAEHQRTAQINAEAAAQPGGGPIKQSVSYNPSNPQTPGYSSYADPQGIVGIGMMAGTHSPGTEHLYR